MIFDEFDGIHASDEIKQKTLHNVMKQRSRKKRTGMTAALTLCVTCLLVVLFQPWRLMEASPAPAPAPTLAVYSYVTLDINPSMEWKLDEQQRVVRVTAYNKDADNILTELQLEGVQLDTALRMLLDNEQFSAYMKTGFLEVSVYSENSSSISSWRKWCRKISFTVPIWMMIRIRKHSSIICLPGSIV